MRVESWIVIGGMAAVVSTGLGRLVSQERPMESARVLVGPNVLVSWQDDCYFRELHVAADPANSRHLLASGMCSESRHPGMEMRSRGFYSWDGGYSWHPAIYPELTPNRTLFGDPQVAFGKGGVGLYTATGSIGEMESAIAVFRSPDGGVTWEPPAPLTYMDRPQIVVDHSGGKFDGNIYINGNFQGDHGSPDYHVGLYRSTDGGRTWVGPVSYADHHERKNYGYNESNPLVFTDGELFVPFIDFRIDRQPGHQPKPGEYSYQYWFVTSKDGGVTFSAPSRFALEGGGEIAGASWHFLAVDNSNGPYRDRVYVAWIDRHFYISQDTGAYYPDGMPPSQPARLWVSHSSDRGKIWSKPVMVAPSPNGDQFPSHTIAVNRDGVVAVSWYDTRNTKPGSGRILVDRYIAASIDGGETFLPAKRVSSVSTDGKRNAERPNRMAASGRSVYFLPNGYIDGSDYLGLTADADGVFHEMWEDGRTGTSQMWTARITVESADSARRAPQLEEADVTDSIQVVLDPLRDFAPAGTMELPVRIKNVAKSPIYGPVKVEVVARPTQRGPQAPTVIEVLNAGNRKTGVGAQFDYTKALGDIGMLPPGAISEGVVWRLRLPANSKTLPNFVIKVTARKERPR